MLRTKTRTVRTTIMIGFRTSIIAAIMSIGVISSASAQCPPWANQNPASFQAQYPNRDVLNDCELTPAGRMGLELPGGAAPVFGQGSLYDGSYANAQELRGMRLHHVRRQQER